jgi:protein-S-isoprenylcysteine O-methyltransferase Ste14
MSHETGATDRGNGSMTMEVGAGAMTLNVLTSHSAPVERSGARATRRGRSARRFGLVMGNAVGAAFAGYLLLPNLRFFVQTGRLIGLLFVVQQVWVVVVFLSRRMPRTVSRRPLDWIAAYAGWFTSFLVRPGGDHLGWALTVGFCVQLIGLALWAWAFSRLARSFGVVPADRGLVTRGPYAIVRHPLYTAYVVGGVGYLLQSLSVWNALVDLTAVGWQLVRIRAEERHLDGPQYAAYRARVKWRLCPGLW